MLCLFGQKQHVCGFICFIVTRAGVFIWNQTKTELDFWILPRRDASGVLLCRQRLREEENELSLWLSEADAAEGNPQKNSKCNSERKKEHNNKR